jgi:pyruvate,water dikinase
MAVVVQALVPATVAGVADTVDVTSGARDVVTISASWGLGRTVVDGAVRPDCWRVLRDGLHVLELRIGDKATRAGLGLDEVPEPVPEAMRRRPCLTMEQAVEVASLALKAEAVVGGQSGADVEWAFEGDTLWLLQARPLVKPLTGPANSQAATKREERAPSAPGPSGPTPAFPFTWPDADAPRWHWSRDSKDGRAFGVIQPFELDSRHQFYNAIEWTGRLAGRKQCTRAIEVNGYMYYARVANPADEESRLRQAEAYLRPIRALHQCGESLYEAAFKPAMLADMRRYGALKPDTFTAPELAAHLEEMMRWYEHVFILHFTGEPWDELSPIGRCAGLYRELTGDEDPWAVYTVFKHAPTKDNEAVEGLIEMARIVQSRPALRALFERGEPEEVWRQFEGVEGGEALRERLDAFLDVFALQCGASQGVLKGQVLPGWGEEPALVVALIQRYLAQDLDALEQARQRSKEQYARDVQQLRDKVAGAAARTGVGAEQLAQFDFWFEAARRMIQIDLEHNYFLDSPPNALLHRALMACGRRLAAAGVLDDAQCVWWLRAHHITAALRGLDAPGPRPDWRALVAAHKAQAEWQRSLSAPLYLGAPPPPPPDQPPATQKDAPPAPANVLVKGLGAVPGVITGRVRLVDPNALVPDVNAGDVFVAANCGALWAAVMPAVGAVVLDSSGPHEHAMRVCREFGIPAIVQAGNATAVLREGQQVVVDGERGWVVDA